MVRTSSMSFTSRLHIFMFLDEETTLLYNPVTKVDDV